MESRASVEATTAVDSSPRLTIQVLATTLEGTACALERAKQVTAGVDARVVLFVPVRKAFRPAGPAGEEPDALIARHRAAVADAGVRATVLACVCDRVRDMIGHLIAPSGLVIVGGHRGWWLPSRERRLVGRLAASGYPVIFAQIGADFRERALTPVAS
jgi:hypothetical protein